LVPHGCADWLVLGFVVVVFGAVVVVVRRTVCVAGLVTVRVVVRLTTGLGAAGFATGFGAGALRTTGAATWRTYAEAFGPWSASATLAAGVSTDARPGVEDVSRIVARAGTASPSTVETA
jgi:hypothetical protein